MCPPAGAGRRAGRGKANLLQVFKGRICFLQLHHGQIRVPQNSREQIIEIMRHSAGERPHRFHLLRHNKLLLACQ